jgi:hypothetical protein
MVVQCSLLVRASVHDDILTMASSAWEKRKLPHVLRSNYDVLLIDLEG